MLLKPPEESFSLSVSASNDLYLDDIVNKLHPAVLPTSLIGGGLGTDGKRAENSNELLANLLDLLSFDLPAIVIF